MGLDDLDEEVEKTDLYRDSGDNGDGRECAMIVYDNSSSEEWEETKEQVVVVAEKSFFVSNNKSQSTEVKESINSEKSENVIQKGNECMWSEKDVDFV